MRENEVIGQSIGWTGEMSQKYAGLRTTNLLVGLGLARRRVGTFLVCFSCRWGSVSFLRRR
jgi:hypothetical protein